MTSAALPLTKHTLPRTGVLLFAAGVLLLLWGGWNLVKYDQVPLHSYQLEQEGPLSDFAELEVKGHEELALQRYAVSVDSLDRPVAAAYIAEGAQGRVLMQWNNQLAEPFLYLQGQLSELSEVAAAIDNHAAENTNVLGWWDELRRLQVLSGSVDEAPAHHHETQLFPTAWLGEKSSAWPVEEGFWSSSSVGSITESRYQTYLQALLEEEEEAARRLSELAGGQELLLLVNVADAFKLGMAYPERYGIGYKDFADTGNLHGTIERVKGWLEEQDHRQYMVQRTDDQTVRVFYLTDEASQGTLISSLLPFSGRGPIHLKHFDLVYQYGSYWVYQLKNENASVAQD